MLNDNVNLCLMRWSWYTSDFSSVLCTKNIIDINFYWFQTYHFPLYLYSESIDDSLVKTANLDMKIIQPIIDSLKLVWIENGEGNKDERTVY